MRRPIRSFVIAKADQAVTPGAAPSGLRFGDPPFGVSATVATINVPPHILPTAPNSNEAIAFASTTSGVCSVGPSANNTATVTILAKGACTIMASVPGDLTEYQPGDASVTYYDPARGDDRERDGSSELDRLWRRRAARPGSITTGSTFSILPATAPCNTTTFATTQSGVPPAPASVGSYAIATTVISTVNVSCDVTLNNATLP